MSEPLSLQSRLVVVCLAIVVGVSRVTSAQADCPSELWFLPATSYPTDGSPGRLLSMDVNHDGILDQAFAVSHSVQEPGGVVVRLGSGVSGVWDGTFLPDSKYAVGSYPVGLISADFNRDGLSDLAFSDRDSARIQVLIGTDDGGFSSPLAFAAGSYLREPAAGDFNGDDILDIAVPSQGGHISLLFGGGADGTWDGTFGSPVKRLVDQPASQPLVLIPADFDEDGITDVAVLISYPPAVAVLIGTGSGGVGGGGFGPAVMYDVGDTPGDMAIADVNRDGIGDLLVSGYLSLDVLIGQGTGGVGNGVFGSALSTPNPAGDGQIGLGDFNGDGVLDVALSTWWADAVSVFPGAGAAGVGNGSFSAPRSYLVGDSPYDFSVADYNEDGLVDFAVPSATSRDISILLGGCQSQPTPRAGVWTENGIPICTALSEQNYVYGVADGSGGALFAWHDERNGPRGDVYATRIDRDGQVAAGWTPGGNQVSPVRRSIPSFHRIVSDGEGGMIVAWVDKRDGASSIYVHRLVADGSVAPGWPSDGIPIGSISEHYFDMDGDGLGGAVFAWRDDREERNGGQLQVYANRINRFGRVASGWLQDGVPLTSGSYVGYQDWPYVARDDAGGLFVAWYSDSTCGYHGCSEPISLFRLKHVTNGAVDWTRFGTRPFNMIVADGAGGVLWGGGYGPEAGLSRVDRAGTILWTQALQDPLVNYWLTFTADGSGGGYATWFRVGQNGLDISAAHYLASGALAPGWPAGGLPITTAPRDQWPTRCVADGLGGALFAWLDYRSGLGNVYAAWVDAAGALAPGWIQDGTVVCDAAGGQYFPAAVASEAATVIVAWTDSRNGGQDIYAQRITIDGPVAALISLVRAVADPTIVRLEWQVLETGAMPCAIYRRTDRSEWELVATRTPDGHAIVRYEDQDVKSGQRYGYRLGVRRGEQFSEEVWLTVPAQYVLALDGARPNPASEGLRVSLSLHSSETATLEIFDLVGRSLMARDVGLLGPGRHVVDLGRAEQFPPGLYFLRLRQGNRALVSRVSVVQ